MKGHKHSKRTRDIGTESAAIDLDCLHQAEICCEQARTAAGLKRFTAARGLFTTAAALCHRAIALNGTGRSEAERCLDQLNTEMLAYSELAKSRERPLLMRAHMNIQSQSEFSVTA